MSIRVLGIAGSLRAASYNRALLRAAVELAPAGIEVETAEIRSVPFYDGDVEAQGIPQPVQDLRARITAADALLIVTPEYNYSIPGVLKNAIDWVSRPPDPPLAGKPAAMLGASMGMGGTARAQYHLRQVGVATNLHFLNRPEVAVARAHEKFDAEGRLTDERTRKSVIELLTALGDWTRRLQGRAKA